MPVLPPTDEFDLRQQRGRHLHEIDAAAQDRRGKAGEIADHAAAERDDQIVALDPGRDQRLADLFEAGIGLRPLAFRDDDARGRDAGRGQRRFGRSSQCLRHGAVGDDRGAHAGPQRGDARAERGQHAAADDDVIGAVAERDIDRDDRRNVSAARSWLTLIPSVVGWAAGAATPSRARSASMHSSTMRSCGTSRETDRQVGVGIDRLALARSGG